MKRRIRSIEEIITRLVTTAMLGALGIVLMAFVQIPNPLAPWLKIEISEIVTIVAYALYGFPGGIAVAVIKTLANMFIRGPSALGLGDATAFITSCTFLLGLFITSHLKWFKRGIKYRIFSYLFIALLVTIVMTLLNALFITPTYLTVFGPNPKFLTCFHEGAIQDVTAYLTKNNDVQANGWLYMGAVGSIYAPFNLMKAAACFIIYEALLNRLIFVFMKRSAFFNKYFVGDIFTKKVEDEPQEKEEEQPQE